LGILRRAQVWAANMSRILVREQTVVLTANEPQNHLLRAQELLDRNDFEQASGELRMAATYLDMQASRRLGQLDQQLS
jgi:hypothetical protein